MGWLERSAPAPGLWRAGQGVRAGWRVAMFLALTAGFVLAGAALAAPFVLPRLHTGAGLTPGFVAVNEALLVVPAGLASGIMLRLEGRGLAACGLAGRRRAARCAAGFALGVGLLAVLAALLLLTGHARVAWGGLGLAALGWYALAWAAASLFIGFTEEFTFRGYLLQTLTRGGGFWQALMFTSLLFAALHFSNHGEGWLGALNAALGGAVFALGIRRSGALWWSIGLHGGWDYAENFLFGTPDSGQSCAFTLLRLSPAGAPWLSGGATGPEGSLFATVLLTGAALALWAWPVNKPE